MLNALFYSGDVPFKYLYIPMIYKEIYIEGIYTDVFNEKEPNSMVIMDVGANIGIVTHFMRDYAKKLYAIEPAQEHFEALKQNKEYNKWDNVEIFNMAMAADDGEAELRLYENNRTSHSIVILPDTKNAKTEKIRTISFSTFFKENKIDHVDFIKFDVEGAEEQILFSNGFVSVADKIEAIEIEFHFADFMKIVEHLLKLGFKAKRYECTAIVFLFFK
jgi:FkbM family methyltransferase